MRSGQQEAPDVDADGRRTCARWQCLLRGVLQQTSQGDDLQQLMSEKILAGLSADEIAWVTAAKAVIPAILMRCKTRQITCDPQALCKEVRRRVTPHKLGHLGSCYPQQAAAIDRAIDLLCISGDVEREDKLGTGQVSLILLREPPRKANRHTNKREHEARIPSFRRQQRRFA